MCTVTYLPTGNNQFLFTSNRDEFAGRSASKLVLEKRHNKKLLYPQDALAKGTWIAISDHNQLVCILNGAFEKHHHSPPYRLSRGLMALDFFGYKDAPEFFQHFDFIGIEPFTMVIYDKGKLYDFRWDEIKKHIEQKNPSDSHIWASCTLYSPEWQNKRIDWFEKWESENPNPTRATILDFHTNAGEGDLEYDIVMNIGDKVRTTSITSLIKSETQLDLRFENLVDDKIKKSILEIA